MSNDLPPIVPAAKHHRLEALKRDLARLDGSADRRGEPRRVALGVAEIDAHLPAGGLQLAALHEIAGLGGSGFAAACLGRVAAERRGLLLWCQHRRRVVEEGCLYGPGLAAFGIDTARLVVVDADNDGDVLWTLEEALRSSAVAGVVGEIGQADLFATRRLQLAAETGGGIGFSLRTVQPDFVASAAVTRWRVTPRPAPSPWPELGGLAWQAELWRCKGAAPARWEVLFDEPTLRFALAAPLADRALAPRPGAAQR